jgi:hypothetical protein
MNTVRLHFILRQGRSVSGVMVVALSKVPSPTHGYQWHGFDFFSSMIRPISASPRAAEIGLVRGERVEHCQAKMDMIQRAAKVVKQTTRPQAGSLVQEEENRIWTQLPEGIEKSEQYWPLIETIPLSRSFRSAAQASRALSLKREGWAIPPGADFSSITGLKRSQQRL